ncbi:MAG: hypothetical protein AB2L21_10855 [Anaerolineaceae bacterium]
MQDYLKEVSKNFPDLNWTDQAIFGMAASILMDVVWQRVLKDEYGKERTDELSMKMWEIVGAETYPLYAKMLGLPEKLSGKEDAKKVIKGIYRAYMVPMKITRDDDEYFNFELLGCPYNGYKAYFRVQEGDFICKNWWAVHMPWLYNALKAAGLDDLVAPSDMKKTEAMCCGADTCKLSIKWKK